VVEFAGPHRDADTLLRAYRMLDRQLGDHAELLSGRHDGTIEPGAVTVAVAGIVDARELLAAQRHRYAFAEGSFDDIGLDSAPPELVPMISEPWSRRFWLGRPGRDLGRGAPFTACHDRLRPPGRPYGADLGLPTGSRRARRRLGRDVLGGVDVIADADQAGLARYLRRHPVRRPGFESPAQSPRHRPPTPRPPGIATNQATRSSRKVNGG